MYFYDTCALLNMGERAFQEPFYIASTTLQELEEIKTSSRKDVDIKAQARNVTRLLWEKRHSVTVIHSAALPSRYARIMSTVTEKLGATDDLEIFCFYLTAAYFESQASQEVIFVTDDLNLFLIASDVLGQLKMPLQITNTDALLAPDKPYTGYQYFDGSEEQLARFYANLTVNTFDLEVNEYIFIPEINGGWSGYRWTGMQYELLYSRSVKTRQFGSDFRARDICQRAAIDSIMNNQVTAISGPAGSGKSLLSLVCAFDLIERGMYDRIVMLVNPAKVSGAVDMGFYPGTAYDKLSESFVGHMLDSKIGDRVGVENLRDAGRLELISMADMRGMEVGERDILYITECQNTSRDLLKLCLSRANEDAKVIFEGDFKSQVDSSAFVGEKNGMKRAINILKGQPFFGYVELNTIWRSELAKLISAM